MMLKKYSPIPKMLWESACRKFINNTKKEGQFFIIFENKSEKEINTLKLIHFVFNKHYI